MTITTETIRRAHVEEDRQGVKTDILVEDRASMTGSTLRIFVNGQQLGRDITREQAGMVAQAIYKVVNT